MAEVELIKVTKRFGATEVVHGVDLQIHDNEFIVLVGPSGCGKSTILRMIAGLESLSGGEIRIGNRAVNRVAPKERNVAMVFQNYALYPHMTVSDNMGFSLRMQKRPRKERDRRVREVAEILELSPFLDRKPAALSGGQRQRVAMGRAIIRKPEVFLFDEPLSNLDAQLRTQMRMELKKLHLKMKTTTIYVTHDQIEAMTLADRIVILKDGYIQQVGTPIDVFEKPESVFVARFIGNPPANVLAGVMQRSKEQGVVALGELNLSVPKAVELEDGREVLVGIRPDAIKSGDALASVPEAWQFQATVIVSEILGGQSLLEFEMGGNQMIAELEGRILLRPGDSITLGFDLNRMLLFDPQTQLALRVHEEINSQF
jgi:multiple sugar transport system ATP-binding protein